MISSLPDPLLGAHLTAARLDALAESGDPTDDEACHLLACASCGNHVSGERSPSPLDDLPLLRAAPEAFDLEAAERRLLVAAQRPEAFFSPYRIAVSSGLLALSAAALLLVALRTKDAPVVAPPVVESHATIQLAPGGKIATASSGADEVVGLVGEASFEVRKLPPGERFRVRIGADEVEVRGTRFTVQTEGQSVSKVVVDEGVVEVRAACCAARTLHAGESWSAPGTPLTAPAGSASTDLTPPSSAPPATSAATPSGDPKGPSGAELLAQGTAAYDAGRYAAAAVMLARAVATEPGAAWARDANTLAGAARVLSTPAASIPALGVSAASFDAAAARARQRGDAKVSAAASLGAARHSSGKSAENRFCAIQNDGALSADQRKEAASRCRR